MGKKTIMAYSKRTFTRRPVAITGLGAVTAFGEGVESFGRGLKRGIDTFSTIVSFSIEGHRTQSASEIPMDLSFHPRRVERRNLSKADILVLKAVEEALQHAVLFDPLKGRAVSPERTGIVVGTAAGGIRGLESFFRKKACGESILSPGTLLTSFCLSATAVNIAGEFIIHGPRLTLATVCSSSGLAMAAAMELLEWGEVDRVVVAGVETLSEVTLAGFNSLRSVAPDRCRPFDLNRTGMILGESAGAVILESTESAEKRDIPVLACLGGYGLCTDLHHFTAPQPEGKAISRTIEAALEDAGVPVGDIDYVAAHGTGTLLNDVAETRGLRRTFGSRAYELAVSSVKSMLGHQLGAASIMQVIAVVLAMEEGVVPPTANLETRDPECDLDYVAEGARALEIRSALSNSFAFGGSNISLVLKKTSDEGPVPVRKVLPEKEINSAVITGIGIISPLGIGREAFSRRLNGETGLTSLGSLGKEWSELKGGLVDMESVREKIPPRVRRRLNRQASFLFVSLGEAMADANINSTEPETDALTYGTAFGCSGNVHAFYSTILAEGPKFCSPQEFNLSVTNAPPSLVAREFGLEAPIWVFAGDEASWELSFHWAVNLIERGRAERVIVNAAEELSGSIMEIHNALGLFANRGGGRLSLGEGALSMVLESFEKASERKAGIYGTVQGFGTVQDSSCGPMEYSEGKGRFLREIPGGRELSDDQNVLLVRNNWPGDAVTALPSHREASYCPLFGLSGLSGGFSLAAALLDGEAVEGRRILVLTKAKGGVDAGTIVKQMSSPSREFGGRIR